MSKRFPPIPRFAEPYPDESCYSILCRSAVWAAMSTAKFCREMFEKKRYLSCFLWQPFHSEEINRWFDDAADRVQDYLQKHSCIPYRYPFLSKICQGNIEDWAVGEELTDGTYKRLTLNLGCRAWAKHYLFYCPECVKSDRQKYGETYWHMIPQLPGVYVCPVHAVPLEVSALQQSYSWMDLYPAEYWISDMEPKRGTISYDDLQLAMDSKWMMENGWKTEIRLGSLLEGLTNWQFEQAEAMTNYFTHQRNVKNETVYHILLANMKRMSISEFVEKKEIIVN